jgi:hypothetical protein
MHNPSHPVFFTLYTLPLSLPACADTAPMHAGTDPSESTSSDTTSASQSSSSPDPTNAAESTTTASPSADETTATSFCGDSRVDDGEACDDGINDGSYGGCLPDCSAPAGCCGDGLVQPEGREACDDGEYNGTTSCNAWCRVSGTKLAEIEGLSGAFSVEGGVAVTDGGRVFTFTSNGDLLWEVRDLDLELSSAHVLQPEWSWEPFAMADLGDGRIAITGGNYWAGNHELRLIDIDPFDDEDAIPTWLYQYYVGPDAVISSLLVVDGELWLFGDAITYGFDHQQDLWIHRVDPNAKSWDPPWMTRWVGRNAHLRPRAVLHPSTGLIAVFQAETGLGGLGMRMFVLDPSTGEEVFADYDPTLDNPSVACLRPDGQLAVFAYPEAGGAQQVVGFALAENGELSKGPSQTLDLGTGSTRVVSCVTAPDANLLVGSVGDDALVVLAEDLLGDGEAVAWQHIGVQVGLDAKEAALGADYRDGRFYVSFGWQTALAVYAR